MLAPEISWTRLAEQSFLGLIYLCLGFVLAYSHSLQVSSPDLAPPTCLIPQMCYRQPLHILPASLLLAIHDQASHLNLSKIPNLRDFILFFLKDKHMLPRFGISEPTRTKLLLLLLQDVDIGTTFLGKKRTKKTVL